MANRLLLLAAAAALVSPALSHATVFAISNTVVGNASPDTTVTHTVSGTLTTDGATGFLDYNDITGFDLTLSNGTLTEPIRWPSASYDLAGVGLQASADDLIFDFSSFANVEFDSGNARWYMVGAG
jgi:hypothetical protein